MSVGIVVGNPKPQSRTFEAARVVAAALSGSEPDFAIDLASYGPELLDWSSVAVADAIAQATAARLVVIATPTYKASYTGLLKLFLDRFGAGSLSGVTAVPLQLGGDWRHSLAPEVHLKPVLAELGASTPTRALYLLDTDAGPSSEALQAWLPVARSQLGAVGALS